MIKVIEPGEEERLVQDPKKKCCQDFKLLVERQVRDMIEEDTKDSEGVLHPDGPIISVDPLDEVLKNADYQRSPYIKLQGGDLYFDETGSPHNSNSPAFEQNTLGKHLHAITKSAQARKRRAQEIN